MARRRRPTFWLGKTLQYVGVGTGVSSYNIVTSAQMHETTEDPTLIRVVGRIWFGFERDDFKESMRSVIYLGLHCSHEDLPEQDPQNDISAEMWMWQGMMMSQATFTEYPDRQNAADTIIGGSTQSRATQHNPTGIEHIDFDIRAMRKAPLPCELVLAAKTVELMPNTGASHKLVANFRCLFKA